jgi:hypothetical protein
VIAKSPRRAHVRDNDAVLATGVRGLGWCSRLELRACAVKLAGCLMYHHASPVSLRITHSRRYKRGYKIIRHLWVVINSKCRLQRYTRGLSSAPKSFAAKKLNAGCFLEVLLGLPDAFWWLVARNPQLMYIKVED